MDAWLLAVRWEVFTSQRQQVMRLQLQQKLFQAWVLQWHQDRKVAAVQRLSALFPCKRGQRKGLAALRRNVKFHSRKCALQKVHQAAQQADRKLLEACWADMLRNLERCQLMVLYLSWADANRVRTHLCKAFSAWLAWRRKRKVVIMSNGSQMLALWRWIRRTWQAPRGGLRKDVRQTGHALATWWDDAAELLFNAVPCDIHPHRMKAVKEDVLSVFVSALLKKMMEAWMRQAREMQEVFQQTKLRMKTRFVDAWKGAAARCRRLREQQQHVSIQRCRQTKVQALHHWSRRWSRMVQHQQNLRDFDVACWHRSCRRAMSAWLMARRWEVKVASQITTLNLRWQQKVFEAWLMTWYGERKEALLLHQSERLLHKSRLRRSFQALHWHAQIQQSQLGWIKRWWILARISRRCREVEALEQKAGEIWRDKRRQVTNAVFSIWRNYTGVRKAAHHAGQSVRRRHQQAVLLTWHSTYEARQEALRSQCEEVVNRSLLLRAWRSWIKWYRRNLALRRFATKVFARLRRTALLESVHAWAEVACQLAARETRYLLQVNDFQRQSKQKVKRFWLRAWQQEAKRSADAARLTRLQKVFACWRLASQEQLLLQKYLQECASINFQESQKSNALSVGPADLERIYREMADYRWNVDAWDMFD